MKFELNLTIPQIKMLREMVMSYPQNEYIEDKVITRVIGKVYDATDNMYMLSR